MAPPRQEEETMADRIKATISGSEDSSTASSASEDPVPAPSSKRRVLRRPYLILSIVVMSSILLAVVIFLAVTVRPSRAQLPPTPPPPPKDPDHRLADGHHRVLFTFGASFTTTGFSLNRPWPSEQNVIGNPAWPGRTTSNGPVWPNYLATNHNSTLTYLFNFAESGAVTDKQLTRPGNARSFEEQIEHLFIPNFVGEGRKPEAEWDPLTTSFGVFVGLNDIDTFYKKSNVNIEKRANLIVNRYFELVGRLYDNGARKVFLFNLNPQQLAPRLRAAPKEDRDRFAEWVGQYNEQMRDQGQEFRKKLRRKYPDAKFLIFDNHAAWKTVVENRDEYCFKSVKVIGDGGCDSIWANDFHPGFEMQRVITEKLAEKLFYNELF